MEYVGDLSACDHVTVCDINENMLNEGQKRAQKNQLDINKWELCSADALPFEDESFNAYTISFGIRNCTDKDKVSFYLVGI